MRTSNLSIMLLDIALPNNYKHLCKNSKTFERYSFVSGDIEGKKYRGI